ncbi:helix-turn-helix transcriptional regulator [Streptomyces luteireticuli]|uniref:Helix-turn-helix transcriptional regulator n=2 Tax=Streptomyces luteireticuli TaxID=173858 RepID=A0ABP3ISW5_9ACTN
MRLLREEVPGFTAKFGRACRPYLNQDEVAILLKVSRRWYAALERGEENDYSNRFLDAVTRVLRLSDSERHTLFTVAANRQPPVKRQSIVNIDAELRRFVAANPFPCYISDEAFDVLFCNDAAAEQYQFMRREAEPNTMLWALTDEGARIQLVDWERSWAPPMAAQLRHNALRYPNHERLQEVVKQVKADETARAIYDGNLRTDMHPDGARRKVYFPHHHDREFEVGLIAMPLLRNPGIRVMSLVPVEEITPRPVPDAA